MSQRIEVAVPDLGDDFAEVDVVEVLVKVGDEVEADDGLITLESDKASMEVPSPAAGKIAELRAQVGDKVSNGTIIALLESTEGTGAEEASGEEDEVGAASGSAAAGSTDSSAPAAPPAAPAQASTGSKQPMTLPQSDQQTEIVVLGSGPGGYTAAFRAADLGKKVVLVERYASLGGVCLNVGCIPSKALLHMAKVVDEAASFADHGVSFGSPTIDLDGLRDWKTSVVGRLTSGLATMAKQRKVTVVQGTGRFSAPHQLTVEAADGSTSTIAFEHAIIAAGSQSVKIPGLPYDDPRLMDSTGALELRDVPGRLLIIGGGIIGLEMATVYQALGSKVTVVELLDRLIPGADKDLVRPLQKRITQQYENIFLGTKVTAVEAEEAGLRVSFEGKKAPDSDVFDRVLLSVGRRPNGLSIGADTAGVHVDERGFIAVDRQLRTNVDHIFAIGDIVGQPMLAHKAVHEAKVAAEVIAGHNSYFDARVIPSVAYTDPEVAWVGLTEEQAKAEGIAYEKGSFPWAASGRALAIARSEGMSKLLFDPDSHRLLGAGVVGPNAGDLIAETALAIEMDAEASDIGLTIHPHPTLSETVAMAAEAFEGTLTDLYLPKKKKRSK